MVAKVKCIGFACGLFFTLSARATEPLLIYSDDFSFYVSSRISSALWQSIPNKNIDEATRFDYLNALTFIYRKYLISCDGPLDELNKATPFASIPDANEKNRASPLLLVGRIDYLIWPIIQRWEQTVRVKAVSEYAEGKWSFELPKCTNPMFKSQNKF